MILLQSHLHWRTPPISGHLTAVSAICLHFLTSRKRKPLISGHGDSRFEIRRVQNNQLRINGRGKEKIAKLREFSGPTSSSNFQMRVNFTVIIFLCVSKNFTCASLEHLLEGMTNTPNSRSYTLCYFIFLNVSLCLVPKVSAYGRFDLES